MSEICTRAVTKNDLTQLIQLCVEHAAFENAQYDPQGKSDKLYKALFSNSAPLCCYVAEQADALIGYVTATREFSTWDADYFLHMDCLYLTEKNRGKGIGALFIKRLQQYASDCGCTHIQWQTPADNADAIDFYRRIGATHKDKKRFFLRL